jgi:peptide/nickel transport system substrate-binding protein
MGTWVLPHLDPQVFLRFILRQGDPDSETNVTQLLIAIDKYILVTPIYLRIMKSTNLSTLKIMAVFTVLLLSSMITPMAKAGVSSSIGTLEGPYFKELRFKIYATSEAEVSGLLSGDVDVVDFFEAEQIPDIQSGLDSGKLATKQNAEQGMWVFSLQCERYPLNLVQFRRAIAYLCDKDKYVREGLQGLGYKLETFLGSPGYGVWSGKSYTTYNFNPTKAAEILDSLGFVKGADGKRIDPKTGITMRPLVIIARTEHPHRIFSARELAKQFDAVGIPYDLQEVPRSVASPRVMQAQDYDIYTAGWGGGPDVDWLYDLYYSTSPPSQNYELFKNSTVDAALDKLKYGKTNAQLAQKYLSEQVPFIPLYAKAYLSPYNARLKNVVDLPWWSGVTNWLTFTVATDKTQKYGSVLNIGWTSDPQQPSPMYEINWWWDTMLINEIYDYPIQLDPTTFAEIPWMAKSWKTEPWTAPNGTPGTKITFTLNDGIKWHDGQPVTADDLVFTWTYAQKEQNPVYISYLTSFVKGEAPDKLTAIAYMNTTSYWALHWVGANIPIIPKHIWENIKDSVKYQPVSEGNLIGSGPYIFKEYKPGEYVIVTANPNYFLKPSDSTLSFPTVAMTQGETKAYTSNKAIYNSKPVTNGTYTITVLKAGAVVKSFKGTAAADGSYTATLDTKDIAPGNYDMMVELVAKVGPVGLGSLDEYKLTVSEKPVDYTLYAAILAAIVVVVAAGYIVMRRKK